MKRKCFCPARHLCRQFPQNIGVALNIQHIIGDLIGRHDIMRKARQRVALLPPHHPEWLRHQRKLMSAPVFIFCRRVRPPASSVSHCHHVDHLPADMPCMPTRPARNQIKARGHGCASPHRPIFQRQGDQRIARQYRVASSRLCRAGCHAACRHQPAADHHDQRAMNTSSACHAMAAGSVRRKFSHCQT